ncbi:retron Ec67 family RNA-directed DNA polymerase/endonuclease [Macrococcus capreoli]
MNYNFIINKWSFCNELGISVGLLNYLLYSNKKNGIEDFYISFSIPKKNGEERIIHAPNEQLKFVQKKIQQLLQIRNDEIYNTLNVENKIVHGFVPEKNIITNARIHRNKKTVINIDIEDFFQSIHFGRVRGFFEKDKYFGLSKEVALIIAQLTCYKGHLPQGAPTSPIISNLIAKILDLRILRICKKYKLDYTRYADDMTFSTNEDFTSKKLEKLLSNLEKVLNDSGFKINTEKTRIQRNNLRQDVTGITVNEKLNVNKDYIKKTRAMAHSLYKNNEFYIEDYQGTIEQLEGRFSFINQLDKFNNNISKDMSIEYNLIKNQKNFSYISTSQKITKTKSEQFFKLLNSREKEYQKFLFFKLFYGNPKPLIITEGKTDIKYLKAALKKLYKDYPQLVEKRGNEYIYKVSFLNKASRRNKKISKLQYFLNISEHGGDVMKNIFSYYDEENKYYPSYYNYFDKLRNHAGANNPVILFYDNEINRKKDSPIKSFINHANLKSKVEKLKEHNKIHITKNLYLLTHSLKEGVLEGEIEDLFDIDVLNHEINGKKFSRKNQEDKNKYGKEIFSNYVYSNYQNINFHNFKQVLDDLVYIIQDYDLKKNRKEVPTK